jgi:hypothetical protein
MKATITTKAALQGGFRALRGKARKSPPGFRRKMQAEKLCLRNH